MLVGTLGNRASRSPVGGSFGLFSPKEPLWLDLGDEKPIKALETRFFWRQSFLQIEVIFSK